VRSRLGVGPAATDSDAVTLVLAMIELAQGLADVAGICAPPGLDGIYVGPTDLGQAVGGAFPNDPAVTDASEAALTTVREAAATAND
jgi:4-hydroxy-2-oxoheptanedioate aldolase